MAARSCTALTAAALSVGFLATEDSSVATLCCNAPTASARARWLVAPSSNFAVPTAQTRVIAAAIEAPPALAPMIHFHGRDGRREAERERGIAYWR